MGQDGSSESMELRGNDGGERLPLPPMMMPPPGVPVFVMAPEANGNLTGGGGGMRAGEGPVPAPPAPLAMANSSSMLGMGGALSTTKVEMALSLRVWPFTARSFGGHVRPPHSFSIRVVRFLSALLCIA